MLSPEFIGKSLFANAEKIQELLNEDYPGYTLVDSGTAYEIFDTDGDKVFEFMRTKVI